MSKERQQKLVHHYEDETENIEETPDTDEELQARCLLEDSENEQWQEVISKRDKHKVKEANHASLLSVDSSQNSSSKKIIEVTHSWVKARVTMDPVPAVRVVLEGMFPRAKLERKTSPSRLVAANGEQIRDWSVKIIPFKTNDGIQ